MSRMRLVAVLLLALAGCATEPAAPVPAAPPAPPAAPQPPPTPQPPGLPPAPVSVPLPPPPDQCGAYALTGLVGKPRSEIPVPVDPGRRRVVCSTCPKTLDFSPYRLTIVYDATTGRVVSVGCG